MEEIQHDLAYQNNRNNGSILIYIHINMCIYKCICIDTYIYIYVYGDAVFMSC